MRITHEDLRNCAALAKEADGLREQIVRARAKSEGVGAQLGKLQSGSRVNDPVGAAVANF